MIEKIVQRIPNVGGHSKLIRASHFRSLLNYGKIVGYLGRIPGPRAHVGCLVVTPWAYLSGVRDFVQARWMPGCSACAITSDWLVA